MGLDAGSLSNMFLAGQTVNAAAGAANTYQSVVAQRAEGKYAKQIANDEAAMAELQAKDVSANAEREIALRGLRTRDIIASQRAAAAGRGIDVGSQSVSDLGADEAMWGAMDQETLKNNAWRQVFGLQSEATNLRRGGKHAQQSANANARMTAVSGGLQFGRDVMSGAYQAAQFREKKDPYLYGSTVNGKATGKPASDTRNR
jgi:hypothetical protein